MLYRIVSFELTRSIVGTANSMQLAQTTSIGVHMHAKASMQVNIACLDRSESVDENDFGQLALSQISQCNLLSSL